MDRCESCNTTEGLIEDGEVLLCGPCREALSPKTKQECIDIAMESLMESGDDVTPSEEHAQYQRDVLAQLFRDAFRLGAMSIHSQSSVGGLARLADLLRQYNRRIKPLLHELMHMISTTQESALTKAVTDVVNEVNAYTAAVQSEVKNLQNSGSTDDPAVAAAIANLTALGAQVTA